MLSKLQGWRTVIVAFATFLAGFLQAAGIVDMNPDLIIDAWDKSLMALGAIFAVLRVVTKGPLGKRDG